MSFLMDNMIVYMQNMMESIKKLLKLIREFSSLTFLYIRIEHLENEI